MKKQKLIKTLLFTTTLFSATIFCSASLGCTNEYKEFNEVIRNKPKDEWQIIPSPILNQQTVDELNGFLENNKDIKAFMQQNTNLISKVETPELKNFTADYLLAFKKFEIKDVKYKFLEYEILEVLDRYDEQEGLASVEFKMKVFHNRKPALSKIYYVKMFGFKYVNPHNHLTSNHLVVKTGKIQDGWIFNYVNDPQGKLQSLWHKTKSE